MRYYVAMAPDTAADTVAELHLANAIHRVREEIRDDLSAQLCFLLASRDSGPTGSMPMPNIGDSDAEFLQEVLGDAWSTFPNSRVGRDGDRDFFERSGPRDPRLSLLWNEALVAIGKSFSGSEADRQAELADADRLIGEILGDALGRRCATAWLLDAWLDCVLSVGGGNVTESLWNAARLSEPESWTLRQARLLGTAYALGDSSPAAEEFRGTLARLESEDPQELLRIARLKLLAGNRASAMEDFSRGLEANPELVIAVLDRDFDQPFAELAKLVLNQSLTKARDAVRSWALAVDALHALGKRLCDAAGPPFPAPVPTIRLSVETLDLRSARRLASDLAEEWRTAVAHWSEMIATEEERAGAEAAKLRRFLGNALKERDYWAESVTSLEEEARVKGYALHEYGMFGLFQAKKRRKSEQMRVHYEQCRLNLEQAENLLRQQENRARYDIDRLETRLALLRGFSEQFAAQCPPE